MISRLRDTLKRYYSSTRNIQNYSYIIFIYIIAYPFRFYPPILGVYILIFVLLDFKFFEKKDSVKIEINEHKQMSRVELYCTV